MGVQNLYDAGWVCDFVCQFFELSATPEQMKTNRDLEIDIHTSHDRISKDYFFRIYDP